MPAKVPRYKREGKSVMMFLPKELVEAVEEYIASSRPKPTKTEVFRTAVEDLMVRLGYWPKKPVSKK